MTADTEKHPNAGTITVIVNGRPREVAGKEITFEQVVALAYDNAPPAGDTIFSVTYRKGGNENRPEGVMVEGDSIKIKKGTTFNVSATSRS